MKRLIKRAEFVYCHNCGFDNGDFMWNDDGTLQDWAANLGEKKFEKLKKCQVYKNNKELKEKNPEGLCPKCKQEYLSRD